MFIVTCFLAQPNCRNVLPEHCITIIKHQLCGEGLPSLLPLLPVDVIYCRKCSYAHQTSRKKLVSGLAIQIVSAKFLQESTTILQLKGYIVYMMQKLIAHPPYQECPINLVSFVFPFVCNSRSLDHQFFYSFP